eukprot:Tbor_TRINITY_DN5342_c0_g2::TRINITY_DN5342_c0_g2_i1::g.4551::m.4551
MTEKQTNIATADADLSDLLSVTVNSKNLHLTLESILERLGKVEANQHGVNVDDTPGNDESVGGDRKYDALKKTKASNKGHTLDSMTEASDLRSEKTLEAPKPSKDLSSDVNKRDKENQENLVKRLMTLEDGLTMANKEIENLKRQSGDQNDEVPQVSKGDMDHVDFMKKELDALKNRVAEDRETLNTVQAHVAVLQGQSPVNDPEETQKNTISSFTDTIIDVAVNTQNEFADKICDDKGEKASYSQDIALMKQQLHDIQEKLKQLGRGNTTKDQVMGLVTKEEMTNAIDDALNAMKTDSSSDKFGSKRDGPTSDTLSGVNRVNSSNKFDDACGETGRLEDQEKQLVNTIENPH